jgi:hypothetical protein
MWWGWCTTTGVGHIICNVVALRAVGTLYGLVVGTGVGVGAFILANRNRYMIVIVIVIGDTAAAVSFFGV